MIIMSIFIYLFDWMASSVMVILIATFGFVLGYKKEKYDRNPLGYLLLNINHNNKSLKPNKFQTGQEQSIPVGG